MPNLDSEPASLAPLPGTAAGQPIEARWKPMHDSLLRRRNELIDALADYRDKTREVAPDPVKDGLAETGTESFQRDQLLGMVSLEQETLDEVTAAIAKIEAGTYGFCEATGQPIALDRLKEIPWARFSIEAQREMEAAGKGGKAALGRIGSFDERPSATPFPDAALQGTEDR